MTMWRKMTKLPVFAVFTLASLTLHALAANDLPLPVSVLADKVVVLKSERKLLLFRNNEVLKIYPISLGARPVGPKWMEGDRKTPEGLYILDRHNPHSQYHRSIHISYPNADDLARSKRFNIPTGGDLFLHGLPNDFRGSGEDQGDWTNGCIALTNAAIDEIWRVVPDGTPIEIKP